MEEVLNCFSRSSIKFQDHTGQKKIPILTRIERFQTVTLVWIHQWMWNDAQSLTYYRWGVLWFYKVIHQIPRQHRLKNRRLGSNLSKITTGRSYQIPQICLVSYRSNSGHVFGKGHCFCSSREMIHIPIEFGVWFGKGHFLCFLE